MNRYPLSRQTIVQISFPKLKVALTLAGVLLTNEELQLLQNGFMSDRSKDMVRFSIRTVSCARISLLQVGSRSLCLFRPAQDVSGVVGRRPRERRWRWRRGYRHNFVACPPEHLILHGLRDVCERVRHCVELCPGNIYAKKRCIDTPCVGVCMNVHCRPSRHPATAEVAVSILFCASSLERRWTGEG